MPRRPSSVLQVRVRSPRLVWLGFLGIFWRVIKIGCLIAVAAAFGWAGHQGYQRVVLDNPDFQLRAIDLNPNPVLDEPALVALTGLDLTSNLTRVNSTAMRETLLAHPAITAARIERHLPDTLVVRVTTRQPRAWIAIPDAGIPIQRSAGALLIDGDGVPYPCPILQLDDARALPVITLKSDSAQPLTPGTPMDHASLATCLRLLDSIAQHTPDLLPAIDTLDQPNAWSLRAITHQGTAATFGLRDHPRQLRRLAAALEHASRGDRPLATINLIPRENVPITFQAETPPRAVPVTEPEAIPVAIPVVEEDLRESRRAGDLDAILNRN